MKYRKLSVIEENYCNKINKKLLDNFKITNDIDDIYNYTDLEYGLYDYHDGDLNELSSIIQMYFDIINVRVDLHNNKIYGIKKTIPITFKLIDEIYNTIITYFEDNEEDEIGEDEEDEYMLNEFIYTIYNKSYKRTYINSLCDDKRISIKLLYNHIYTI